MFPEQNNDYYTTPLGNMYDITCGVPIQGQAADEGLPITIVSWLVVFSKGVKPSRIQTVAQPHAPTATHIIILRATQAEQMG